MPDSASTCWVITDGAAGNERQALALAQRLALQTRVWQVSPRAPWSWLAPRLLRGARQALPEPLRRQFAPPWPALAIGCGRTAALYTRGLREWSAGSTYTVQILDPRIATTHYDLVIAPRHDRLSGSNVLTSLGSLNPVDAHWLAEGADAFPDLARLPSPRTAVLIGASHRDVAVDMNYCVGLIEALAHQQARRGGSFMVSTSRRTPPSLREYLRSALTRFPGVFWGGSSDGANPYAGYLAYAERIVVTPDSVNMLSEACAVGVPVQALLTHAVKGKLGFFHKELISTGLLGKFGADLPAHAPLRETTTIAAEVRRRWRESRGHAAEDSADSPHRGQ